MSFYSDILKHKKRFKDAFENGAYLEAVNIGETMIFQYRSNFMDKDAKYADDLFDIAYANTLVGNFEKACKMYKESASIIRRANGTDLNYSYRINNLAAAYAAMGKYDLAVKYFEESYKLRVLLLGESNRLSLESLYNVGNAHAAVQKHDKALRCLKKALKFREKKDNDYIDNLNAVGYVYEAMGDYDSAGKYFQESLALTKKMEGLLSIEYLKNLAYLARFYAKTGVFEKSVNYYDMFSNIAKKLLGERHPYYIAGINGVAEAYEEMGDIASALDYRLQAVELIQESIGTELLYYARTLVSAALLFKRQEAFNMAEKYLLEAIAIKKRVLTEENAEYIKDLIILSGIYFEDRQYDKTMDLMMDALNILEQKNFLLDECIYDLANVYLLLDEFQRMEEKDIEALPKSPSSYKDIDEILKNLKQNMQRNGNEV